MPANSTDGLLRKWLHHAVKGSFTFLNQMRVSAQAKQMRWSREARL